MISLRDRLDAAMPGWDRWYANAFDAAVDLGILRARVCDPSSLLLSRRHATVQQDAEQAFRDKWYVEDEPVEPEAASSEPGGRPRRKPESEESAARRLLADALLADISELDFGDPPDPAPVPQHKPRRKRRRR
ncbi:MAG: hypothetical protein IT483_14710 [Gammaproteobacteria bacterium]|nr:hypothetical protein [Gammaproteobacteria bacterium]